MKQVLVVGAGGREHALAWRLAQDEQVARVFVAPGNAGTVDGKLQRVAIQIDEFAELVKFVKQQQIDLTVIGPEGPLATGIADYFGQHNLALLGPTQAAAKIEASKSYAKQFMRRQKIPTPDWQIFNETNVAADYLESIHPPYVVKADGLFAGKGVVVTEDLNQAKAAANKFLQATSDQSNQILIEQYVTGQEVSLIALCNGNQFQVLAVCRDYKRLGDGDTGPNTGGMGAVCPVPLGFELNKELLAERLIKPVLAGFNELGLQYRGFLYAGIVINQAGTQVLEYNCRLGDPEAQVILPLWRGGVYEQLIAAATGTRMGPIDWSDEIAVGVVVASKNYPETSKAKTKLIIDKQTNQAGLIFQANTDLLNGELVAKAGRVACSVGIGKNYLKARQLAYSQLVKIKLPNSRFRSDIATS